MTILVFAACPSGFWGPSCSLKCNCKRGASCEPITGICHCPAGICYVIVFFYEDY